MNGAPLPRGAWPMALTGLVEQQPGARTAELTRLLLPDLVGPDLARKGKSVHWALSRLAAAGCVRVSVSIEWVGARRIAVCRWYPGTADVPEAVDTESLVLDAVRAFGRATPSAIRRRTRIAYSTLYRVCHRLAARGAIVNIAPAPYQCWILPDGDRTPWTVPAAYHPRPPRRARQAAPTKATAVAPRAKTPRVPPTSVPYINPIRARALGLTPESFRAR